MLNTFHLQTFVAVVDTGSYSAAARYLHMSQPAVSQHIRALEEQLDGVRLFRRIGKRMVTTHAGEELLPTARELVSLAVRAEENIKSLKGQVGGQVTVGCTPSSGERLLAPVLAAFRARFPAVTLNVQVAPSHVLQEWLEAQDVRLALIEEQQRRRGWDVRSLGREQIVLLAPRSHPLLQQEHVPIGELGDQPLILPRPGSPMRRTIDEGLRRRGLPASMLRIALETDSTTMAIQAVHAGIGLAFIAQLRQMPLRELDTVSLAGVPLHQDWYLLRTRDQPQGALEELYSFIVSKEGLHLLSQEGLQMSVE